MKKILALILAVLLVLAMGVGAIADDETTGVMPAEGTIQTENNAIVLNKGIKVTNYNGHVYEPTITYTYTLSNGSAGGTVTDSDGNTAHFKAGSTGYLAVGETTEKTAGFSSNIAATNGEIATKQVGWTFDPGSFPSAGVYRYVVTETSNPADPTSIGITRNAEYDASKFLDVYVKNDGEGLAIYGYALVDDEESAVTTDTVKSQGWNSGNDLEEYKTYNITITKKITGNMADMTAKFPFTVELSGDLTTTNVALDGSGASISRTENRVVCNLGNGETLIIKGLPVIAGFTVSETNPTADVYKVKINKVEGISGTTSVEDNTDVAANNATPVTLVSNGSISNAIGEITIEVENSINTVSPTGVVLRFAPYIIMAGIAVVLLVLAARRRKDTQDKSGSI